MWIEKSVTRVTDRHHEACRVIPNSDPEWQMFLSTPYTQARYFFLHTFWLTTFDFQSRTCYEITLLPLKGFYLSLKKSTLPATAVRFFTLTSNMHLVTSFSEITAVKKNNVTWRRRYVTSYTTYALIGSGWDNMGEIRIQVKHVDILIRYARKNFPAPLKLNKLCLIDKK